MDGVVTRAPWRSPKRPCRPSCIATWTASRCTPRSRREPTIANVSSVCAATWPERLSLSADGKVVWRLRRGLARPGRDGLTRAPPRHAAHSSPAPRLGRAAQTRLRHRRSDLYRVLRPSQADRPDPWPQVGHRPLPLEPGKQWANLAAGAPRVRRHARHGSGFESSPRMDGSGGRDSPRTDRRRGHGRQLARVRSSKGALGQRPCRRRSCDRRRGALSRDRARRPGRGSATWRGVEGGSSWSAAGHPGSRALRAACPPDESEAERAERRPARFRRGS